MKTERFGKLGVSIHLSRAAMGAAAAERAARLIKEVAGRRGTVNMVFAAAPSQDEFLAALAAAPDLPWDRVVAMHMDEYIGLGPDAPQRFARYLDDRLFLKLPFRRVYRLDSAAADPSAECERYAAILAANPVDIVCMGIGENGHIAFNDPPVADFRDPKAVKIVALEKRCREQQVHDLCFARLQDVPERAMSLTVPTLMGAAHLVCVVPGPLKAQAVKDMLRGEVTTACPASILRTHPDAELFLDEASAGLLGLGE
jgi:6-phosphogluconolactonase/Glucosamine-6-phosphate isomerase/deaminase